MADEPDFSVLPLDAIAEWLERHPNIESITITEIIEETYE